MVLELQICVGGFEETSRVHAVQMDELRQWPVDLGHVGLVGRVTQPPNAFQGLVVDVDLGVAGEICPCVPGQLNVGPRFGVVVIDGRGGSQVHRAPQVNGLSQ